MTTVLTVEHLTKNFGKREVLHDISFQVGEDEIVGFVGPNGAGKSTTLKCISGLYRFSNGTITVCEKDILKERSMALSHLGVSIEYPALYPDLTGNDHFAMVGNWRKESKAKLSELKEFSGLKDALKRPVKTYSMGMKQRLILSLTMIGSPTLLILDEPTNGLDPQAIFELREKLLYVKKQGTSVLLSSHQLGEIEKISNRILFIKDGAIIETIQAADLHQKTNFLCKLSSNEKAFQLCKDHGILAHMKEDQLVIPVHYEKSLHEFLELVMKHELKVYHISEQVLDLESYYKKLYKSGDRP